MKDILRQGVFIPRAALLAGLFMAFGTYLQSAGAGERWRLMNIGKRWREGLFLFYLAFLLMSTVFSRQIRNPYQNVFKHFGFRKDEKWNNEIIENILLFIPLTLLFLQAFKPKKPWKASLILSVCVTGFIEVSQLLFWLGQFQFADMFHNIVGGMAGCGICQIGNKIRNRGKAPGAGS